MTYEIYRYIFFGGAVLSVIMLAVAILLFFLFKIPTVIGDLNGSNARKAIENIRSLNESTGDKTYQTSKVNRERGKLTDKISPSGRLEKDPSHSLHGAMATVKITTQELTSEDMQSNETTVLDTEPVVVSSETMVLSDVTYTENETTDLSQSDTSVGFAVEFEITFIHTDEVI